MHRLAGLAHAQRLLISGNGTGLKAILVARYEHQIKQATETKHTEHFRTQDYKLVVELNQLDRKDHGASKKSRNSVSFCSSLATHILITIFHSREDDRQHLGTKSPSAPTVHLNKSALTRIESPQPTGIFGNLSLTVELR